MVATVTASATAAATALANPAAMSFTFTDDFLPPALIRLVAILLLLLLSVTAASCCFSKPPAEVARELGLLGLVKWLISSDEDDDEMGLA